MELQSILTADYLDIIFDNRNKGYGGYELRKHYNQRAVKAMGIVMTALLLAVGLHAFRSETKTNDTVTTISERTIQMQRIVVDIPKPKIEIEPAAAAAPNAVSVAITPPQVVHDEFVTETPPTLEEMKGKEPGTVTTNGDPNGDLGATSKISGTGAGGETLTGVTEVPAVTEGPKEYVEQMPEFNGNVNKYLAANIQYPEMAKQSGTTGKVVIRFVVNEDGSVSNAKVIKGIGAGCEEEALRVINGMPKWKPGKSNGKAVKVYFTLPVNFKMN